MYSICFDALILRHMFVNRTNGELEFSDTYSLSGVRTMVEKDLVSRNPQFSSMTSANFSESAKCGSWFELLAVFNSPNVRE